MSLTPFHLKIVHKLLCNKHRCCCAMQRLVAVLAVADEFCVPQSSHTIVSVRSQPCILWQQEHGMIPFPRQSCTLGTARQSSLTYITTARHVSQMSGECGESVYLPLVASLMTLLPLSTVLGAIGSSVHVQSCTVYLGASSHKPEKHSRMLHTLVKSMKAVARWSWRISPCIHEWMHVSVFGGGMMSCIVVTPRRHVLN